MLVFVCDDMMSCRDPLCHALIELGHEVYSASNGEEIMDAIETPPDILFLDITMPIMDGMETLKRFREVYEEPVVIMLASIGQDQVAKQCLALGADGSGDIHTDFTAYERFSGFEAEKYIFSYINGHVVIGLSDDGKVVWGKETEERSEWFLRDELSSWEGLADLYAGRNAVVLGLKPDGSVVITSNHWNYSEEISQWTNIRIPKR